MTSLWWARQQAHHITNTPTAATTMRTTAVADVSTTAAQVFQQSRCMPRPSNTQGNAHLHATQDNDAPQTHHVAAVEPLGVCTKLCNGLTKLVFLHQRSCSPNWYLLQKTRSVMDRTQSQRDTDETGTCFSRDPTHDRL